MYFAWIEAKVRAEQDFVNCSRKNCAYSFYFVLKLLLLKF